MSPGGERAPARPNRIGHIRDALHRHTLDVLRRLYAASAEESIGRLDRSRTRSITLRGVKQVNPQIVHGRPLERIQASVAAVGIAQSKQGGGASASGTVRTESNRGLVCANGRMGRPARE